MGFKRVSKKSNQSGGAPENSCLNVLRLWDGFPFGDPMTGRDADGGNILDPACNNGVRVCGAVAVICLAWCWFVLSSVVCGWWLFVQSEGDGAVRWLPTLGYYGVPSRLGSIFRAMRFVLFYLFLVFLFVVSFIAVLKLALEDAAVCTTCPDCPKCPEKEECPVCPVCPSRWPCVRPKNTITIEECNKNVEDARTAAIDGCKTDGDCCPENQVCMSDDSRTKVMCNPNEIPPQLCPGGIQCPECGTDSCVCPS